MKSKINQLYGIKIQVAGHEYSNIQKNIYRCTTCHRATYNTSTLKVIKKYKSACRIKRNLRKNGFFQKIKSGKIGINQSELSIENFRFSIIGDKVLPKHFRLLIILSEKGKNNIIEATGII